MDARYGDAVRLGPSEKLVARLWDEQRPLLFPLRTIDGRQIDVVYRGRQRWDRGPDFAGALVAWPDGTLEHGDVEVHVRSGDWRAHGHHRDPNYNGVVLHVVLWGDSGEDAVRQDGARVPVVALARHLAMRLESLPATFGERVEPRSPCWREDLEIHGRLGDILDSAGLDRFQAKAARFEADLVAVAADRLSAVGRGQSAISRQPSSVRAEGVAEAAEQVLYQGIADALGYTQNRAAFRRLAEAVPLALLKALRGDGGPRPLPAGEREDGVSPHPDPLPKGKGGGSVVDALLLGAAGLLPSQRGLSLDEGDGYLGALEDEWCAAAGATGIEPMDAGEWEFFRVRPANFPTRRVAALAALVERWPSMGLAERLVEVVGAGTGRPRATARALEALLLGSGQAGYWASHYDCRLPLRRPGVLIGRQRAAEIVVNVFLPFLAALASASEDRDLERWAYDVFVPYPKRGDNELSRYQAVQITGVPRPRVARSACRQQGLLHIYWTWCERKRCGECPCGGAKSVDCTSR